MAGKGMPQHVRVQVLSQLAFSSGLDPYLNRPGAEAATLLADEHGVVRRIGHGPQRQPLLQRFARFLADGQ
ncbi:hypothetical protein D3C87_1734390 [compost metagenome]